MLTSCSNLKFKNLPQFFGLDDTELFMPATPPPPNIKASDVKCPHEIFPEVSKHPRKPPSGLCFRIISNYHPLHYYFSNKFLIYC